MYFSYERLAAASVRKAAAFSRCAADHSATAASPWGAAQSGSPAPIQYAGQKWASGRCPYRAEGIHGDENSPENVKKGLSLPCFPRFLPSFAAMVPCASFDIRISCIVLSITPAQVRYERGQGLCLHLGGVLPLGRVGAAGQPILRRGADPPLHVKHPQKGSERHGVRRSFLPPISERR